MKSAAFGVLAIAVLLGACRRESPYYETMKLGAADREARVATGPGPR